MDFFGVPSLFYLVALFSVKFGPDFYLCHHGGWCLVELAGKRLQGWSLVDCYVSHLAGDLTSIAISSTLLF